MSPDSPQRDVDRAARVLRSAAAVAAAVVLGTAGLAMAQYQVGTNGQARDANNRIGSNGINDPTNNGVRVNGNQIVTGNVTGGREFRGFVPYTDPGAFRGTTAGRDVDRFVSGSAGVPIGPYSNNNAQTVVPFYGESRFAPPPPNAVEQAPGQPGYVVVPQSVLNQPLSNDLRLTNPYEAVMNQQARPGELILPGPVDPKTQDLTVITATPLYGIRQWRMGDQNDQQFLNNFTDLYAARRQANQLDAATINRMRGELRAETGTSGEDINANDNQLDRPYESSDPTVSNRPLRDTTNNNALSSSGVNTGQGLSNRLVTSRRPGLTLATNSPQYRELQQRLARYRQDERQLRDVNANVKFQEDRRLDEMAQANEQGGQPGGGPPGAPGAPGGAMGNAPGAIPGGPPNIPGPNIPGPNIPNIPGANVPGPNVPGANVPSANVPGGAAQPGGAAPGAQQPTAQQPAGQQPAPGAASGAESNRPKPLAVKSFTQGLPQSAATNVMKEGEELMKAGRFTSALDKFDQVEQVTPNDPLVSLGRATAELGASYYQRADAHLREAFTRNPALLLGQYDLREMLGNDRLDYLVKDLKQLASNDQKAARPVFLLAYIYYNTGDERRANGYLDLAEKRSGGTDPFFKLLRQHWSLPSDTGAGDLNK